MLIKISLVVKSHLMEMILGLKATMDQVQVKRFCFGYFCRFFTSALTLRSPNRYICVFRTLFGFGNFLFSSCEFHKLGVSSFSSTLNFQWIEQSLWRLHVLVGSCAAHQYIEITGLFFRVETKEQVLRVEKSKITGKSKFLEIILGLKVTMDQV